MGPLRCRYCRHREAILLSFTLWLAWWVLGYLIPSWLPLMEADRLHSPLTMFRLSGSEGILLMQLLSRSVIAPYGGTSRV